MGVILRRTSLLRRTLSAARICSRVTMVTESVLAGFGSVWVCRSLLDDGRGCEAANGGNGSNVAQIECDLHCVRRHGEMHCVEVQFLQRGLMVAKILLLKGLGLPTILGVSVIFGRGVR